MLSLVACRCSRQWWKVCIRARRCSFSASRGELPGALLSSTSQCCLVSVTGRQHTSWTFSQPRSSSQVCVQWHGSDLLLWCRSFRRAGAAGEVLADDVLEQLLDVLSAGASLSLAGRFEQAGLALSEAVMVCSRLCVVMTS